MDMLLRATWGYYTFDINGGPTFHCQPASDALARRATPSGKTPPRKTQRATAPVPRRGAAAPPWRGGRLTATTQRHTIPQVAWERFGAPTWQTPRNSSDRRSPGET